MKTLLKAALLALVLPTLVQAADDKIVRLATTTSTDNTGLLAYLLPEFERQSGYQVQVIATGTGKALRHGRNGDVDVVMTHAPEAEAQFVADGFGRIPRYLMMNDFVLLGPASDPAQVKQAPSLEQALQSIARNQAHFVSRGDDSGTHMKEMALWQAAEVEPNFSGYAAIGQGMGPALLTANEMRGYLLSDRGTYLAFINRLDLEVVYEGADNLANPYQIILINETKYPDLNHRGAQALSDWLVSEQGQSLIDQFRVNGKQLFHATYKR
ncbi:substrate-binding domain-containing protein [Ferrimonas marina]|uniref:Tungstate transport system substrate-binding protein n=1 Tax=Ferrimonas marina TaxID=299255 RepID=A0A1M5XWA8_9GAMM|nr:substrate-binding domain-containing protein [Ferrimonas marina]SHI03808.1 tungstate transport system substrate-binding protein [Ferrimonas marina]